MLSDDGPYVTLPIPCSHFIDSQCTALAKDHIDAVMQLCKHVMKKLMFPLFDKALFASEMAMDVGTTEASSGMWGSKMARTIRSQISSVTGRLCTVLDRFTDLVRDVPLQDRTLLVLGTVSVSALHVDAVKEGVPHISCIQLGALVIIQVRQEPAHARMELPFMNARVVWN